MDKDELTRIAKEVHMRYYSQGKFGKEKQEIKEICQLTGATPKEAKEEIYKIMHPFDDATMRRLEADAKRNLEAQRSMNEPIKVVIEEPKNVARCPRCKSTSISYTQKPLSIGRAIVGDFLLGAPGAILGGLSSKKGYCVCMKCGKRWKR